MGFRRKIPKENVRRATSIGGSQPGVYINKAGTPVQKESHQELITCLGYDRDPTVKDYISQPETFTFLDANGKVKRYTPDFKVLRIDGSIEIHEVTIEARRQEESARRREAAAHQKCRERGWKYVVHTDETLPKDTERANLISLQCFRATIRSIPAVKKAALVLLDSGRRMPLADLKKEIAVQLDMHPASVMGALGHMLWLGELQADLTKLLFHDAKPLPDAIVWLPM